MEEEKPKKKRKKAVAADDGAGEHKRPWQENLATMEEIKAFVSDRYYLRYNVVRRGVECRRPSSYDHDGTDWQLISDRIVNEERAQAGHLGPDRIRLHAGVPSLPVLPGPPAAVGRAGLYHGALRVGERGCSSDGRARTRRRGSTTSCPRRCAPTS